MTNVDKLMKLCAELRGREVDERGAKMIARAAAWMDAIDAVADSDAPMAILDRAAVEIEAFSAGLAGEIASDYAYCRLGDLQRALTDCRHSGVGMFDKYGNIK